MMKIYYLLYWLRMQYIRHSRANMYPDILRPISGKPLGVSAEGYQLQYLDALEERRAYVFGP